MKTLICLSLAVSALASPALSFAQSTSAPVTRAQVYADLVRLEQAGYDPSASNDPNYPAAIQATASLPNASLIRLWIGSDDLAGIKFSGRCEGSGKDSILQGICGSTDGQGAF